jgi:hypothetical protein
MPRRWKMAKDLKELIEEEKRKIAEETAEKMRSIKVTEVWIPTTKEWILIKDDNPFLTPKVNGIYFKCSCGFKTYEEFEMLEHLHKFHGLPQSYALGLFNNREEDMSRIYVPFEQAYKILPKDAKIIEDPFE